MENTEKKRQFIINALYYCLIVIIIYCLCKYLLPIMVPFIIAFIVAALMEYPAKAIAKNNAKTEKRLAILFTAIFYILCFWGIFSLGAKIAQSVASFVSTLPSTYSNVIQPALEEFFLWLEERVATVDGNFAGQIDSAFVNLSSNMGSYISNFSVQALGAVSTGVTSIPGLIVQVVVTVVATFFMVSDYRGMFAFFQEALPAHQYEKLKHGLLYARNVLGIYARSYVLLFLLTFVELGIGLTILRIPYSVLVALIIAILDILPILGTGTVLLPWSVILFVIGNVPLGLGILILYLVITAIRNTVEPKLVGKQIGLHPLATLISMYVGLKLFGLLGMIILPSSLAIWAGMKKEKGKADA